MRAELSTFPAQGVNHLGICSSIVWPEFCDDGCRTCHQLCTASIVPYRLWGGYPWACNLLTFSCSHGTHLCTHLWTALCMVWYAFLWGAPAILDASSFWKLCPCLENTLVCKRTCHAPTCKLSHTALHWRGLEIMTLQRAMRYCSTWKLWNVTNSHHITVFLGSCHTSSVPHPWPVWH